MRIAVPTGAGKTLPQLSAILLMEGKSTCFMEAVHPLFEYDLHGKKL